MNEQVIALKISDSDNVATIFNTVKQGEQVLIQDKKGNKTSITALDSIEYGHKIALSAIQKGAQITKYGEEIGVASRDICAGEHVHVHNLESIRGRGDWSMGDDHREGDWSMGDIHREGDWSKEEIHGQVEWQCCQSAKEGGDKE